MAGFGIGYQSDQGQSPGAGQGASSAGLYGAIADILMKRAQDFTYNLQNLDDRVWLMRHFPNFYGWNSQGGGGGGYEAGANAPIMAAAGGGGVGGAIFQLSIKILPSICGGEGGKSAGDISTSFAFVTGAGGSDFRTRNGVV